MKPQLLEDIGDSQSPPDMRSELPASKPYSMPRQPVIAALPRSHFGVWRDRDMDTKTIEEPLFEAPAMNEPFLGTSDEQMFVNDGVADLPTALPEDLVIAPVDPTISAPPPSLKTSRVATWASAVVVLALVAGGSLWLFNDRKDEASLAVVAENLGGAEVATVAAPAPTAQVSPPAPRQAENIPPLVVLKAEDAAESEPEKVAEVVVPAEENRPAVAKQTARKPVPSRNLKKTAALKPEPRRTFVTSKAPTEESASTAFSKACSAFGYREAQCRKRACVLTKFGLACKG